MTTRSETSPTDWLMSFNNLTEQLSAQEIDPIPDFMIDAVYQEPTTNQLVGNSMDPELLAPPTYVSEQNLSPKLPLWFEDEYNDSHPEWSKIDKQNQKIETKDYACDSMTWQLQEKRNNFLTSQSSAIFQNHLNSAADLEEPGQLFTPIPEINDIFPCIRKLQHNDTMLMLPEVSTQSSTAMTTANLNEATAYQSKPQDKIKSDQLIEQIKQSKQQNTHFSINVGKALLPLQKVASTSEQKYINQELHIKSLPELSKRSDKESEAEKELTRRKENIEDSDVETEDSKRLNDNQKISTQTNESATPKSKANLIYFYKNEFLAVRNTHGGFFICKARENVYQSTKKINITWLIEEGSGIYTLDYNDKTELKCVLTNLNLVKLTKGKFRLPFHEFRRTRNILKRSIDAENGVIDSSQLDVTEEHPDGLDLSVYHNEEQLNKWGSVSNNNYPKSSDSSSNSNMMVYNSRTVSYVTSPKPTSSKIIPSVIPGNASNEQPSSSKKRKSLEIANESSPLSTVTSSSEKKSKNEHQPVNFKFLSAATLVKRSPSKSIATGAVTSNTNDHF